MSIKSETQGFDISGKSAAVIGCGGLGCNVCVHLAGAGIGSLFICDYDSISESNLNRQFVYKTTDTGRKKTEAMSDFLKHYAPDCNIVSVDKRIVSSEDLDIFDNCDLIILAVDNAEARKTANDFCRHKNIPLISGGINAYYGSCYLYIPGETPCLDCAGVTQNSKAVKNISSTAGIMGSLVSETAIRYLTGNNPAAGVLMIYDNNEITKLTIKSSKECGCNKEVSFNG